MFVNQISLGHAVCMSENRELLTMKTLLFTGLAGILAVAPGTAIAAVDSAADGVAQPSVDLAFASSTALANPAAGARTMPRMNNMGHVRGMKNMGNMQRMKGFRHAGSHVRRGRMGYDKGYRKPHRGFRLPRNFVRPSFFIGNFGYYGLSQPNHGYGWSRYYDDAVLTDRHGVVQDARYNVDWDRYNQGYDDGYRDGRASYDPSVFIGDDRVVATPHAYGDESTYQGDWDGAYREDGSYQGEWQGTYRDADGRVYEGEYSGTFIGDGHMAPHWDSEAGHYPADPAIDDGHNEELAYLENCKKSSGIGGAIVGGAIGALAGNRIAGRGNRLGGSLIGGGLGAVAGAAIDQGTDRCRNLLKKYGYDGHQSAPYPAHPPVQHRPAYPSGWNGYYTHGYYYPQQPTVTTIVVHSAPVTTTTTTTYVEEEVVHSKPVYRKRWKPATKAVPLKGCQQARCMYD
jgi:Ni/Co efflux regulator RcnB